MPDQVYRWSREKNFWLQRERDLSFEAIESAIEDGNLLDDIQHPDSIKFPGQRMLIVKVGEQVCVVPYVIDSGTRFLKTIYPGRKAKRAYAGILKS
jgi:hypothetical protein